MKFKPRYELTFVLDDQIAEAVLGSASQRMTKQPEKLCIHDRCYDSPDFVAGSETKFSRRRQYRVRQINSCWDVWLQSRKWGPPFCDARSPTLKKSTLRQSRVPLCELKHLNSPNIEKSWAGKWFRKKLIKHDLKPSIETHFDRIALETESLDGAIRLTADRNIRSQNVSADGGMVTELSAPLNFNLVRMKFSVSLPSIFKALIYQFELLPANTSLYRQCVRCSAAYDGLGSTPEAFVPEYVPVMLEAATCKLG